MAKLPYLLLLFFYYAYVVVALGFDNGVTVKGSLTVRDDVASVILQVTGGSPTYWYCDTSEDVKIDARANATHKFVNLPLSSKRLEKILSGVGLDCSIYVNDRLLHFLISSKHGVTKMEQSESHYILQYLRNMSTISITCFVAIVLTGFVGILAPAISYVREYRKHKRL